MICSIILAAGEGTRMKSKNSKLSHEILARPIIKYVAEASEQSGVDKNILIVGKNKEFLQKLFEDKEYIFKEQKIGPQYTYGTGYAVKMAKDEINDDDDCIILNGDIPLIKAETIRAFIDYHVGEKNVGSVMTNFMTDPTSYGRIVKDENGKFLKIVEHRDANEEELNIKEVNPGVYIFKGEHLKKALEELTTDNDQNELYITDVVEILVSKGLKVGTYILEDAEEVFGINSKDQLQEAENMMRRRVNTGLMKSGVIMENSDNIYIEPGVEIGKDTKIYSGAKILGKTVIGEDCVITGDSYIIDSTVGNGVVIKSSYIESSVMEDGSNIGPYSHLRPKAHLGKKVHIGNFVEVKNANMGEGTKAGHLAYIGDADLGSDINIGCGAIFVNYDGKRKFRSTVEDKAFIGSNANIVAPVKIEKEAFVAAGSTVTKDVTGSALYISRPEAREIEGWVERKKKED